MTARVPAAGLLTLVRDRTFLLVQARLTAANVGYTVYVASILWLSYELTHGVFLAGVLLGIETAAYTFTFLAGPLVDRIEDKRWIYLIAYPVQAAASVLLGVSFALGFLSVPLLVAIVVLLAALWDFTWAADSVATRVLFGKDRLFVVSGLGSALGGVVNVAMYVVLGVALVLFGAAGGAYLYGGLLALGAAFAAPIPISTASREKPRYLSAFRAGWDLYRGPAGRSLRQLAVVQSVYGFFISAPVLLLTLLVGRDFGGSQSAFAELYVAYLVGGILIGLLLGLLNPRRRIGWTATLALWATGAALAGAEVVSGALWASLATWFIVGLAMTARITAFSNYMQGRFDPGVLARITGNNYVFIGTASTAGAFVIATLSTTWSPALLVVFVAAGFIASGALTMLLPATRSLSY